MAAGELDVQVFEQRAPAVKQAGRGHGYGKGGGGRVHELTRPYAGTNRIRFQGSSLAQDLSAGPPAPPSDCLEYGLAGRV